MHYLIYVSDENEEGEQTRLHMGPVAEPEQQYLLQCVLPGLRPLSDDEYMQGIAVILHTFARSSYVLHGKAILWCIEWEPGLLVVRFSPDEGMAWVAMRSPVPDFGGRTPLQEDIDAYDDEEENPQYRLVFRPWDAQFDTQYREWGQYEPAPAETGALQTAAMQRANLLGSRLEKEVGQEGFKTWAEACKQNIRQWAGEGLRCKL